MMRWMIFSVAVVALTAIATIGSSYLSTSSPDEPVFTNQEVPTGPTGTAQVER